MYQIRQTGHVGGARRRAWLLVLWFSLGLLGAQSLELHTAWPWWMAAGTLAAATALLIRTRVWLIPVLVAVACIGAAWHVRTFTEHPATLFAASIQASPTSTPLVKLRGVVATTPARTRQAQGALARFAVQAPSTRFELSVREVDAGQGWHTGTGRVWVRVAGRAAAPIAIGESVELLGRFSPVEAPSNPGSFDLATYAADREYCGTVTLSDWSLVSPTDLALSPLERWRANATAALDALRARCRVVLTQAAGDDATSRALLLGLMLGEFDPEQSAVFDAFTRQSLVHVLSISGFHLSVMAGLALLLVRLTGDRGRTEAVLIALLVVTYALIVPPQSPIVRSAVLTLAVMAGDVLGRRYDRLTLLGWVSLGILIWHPSELRSLGFQLSVGLTAALLWLTPHVRDALFAPRLKGTLRSREHRLSDRITDGVHTAIAANLTCWAAALPLLIARTGLISPLAIAAGLIVTPLVTLLLWIGFLTLLIGMLVPGAEAWASTLIHWLSQSAVWLVQAIDALPWSSFRAPPIGWTWTLCTTVAIFAVMRWGLLGTFPATRRKWSLAALCGCATWLLTAWLLPPLQRGVALRIDMIDVGDGTCHLIRSGREAILWDCGTISVAGPRSDIVSTVRALGTGTVSTAVITHPDLDHFGALPDLIEPLGIKRIVIPARFTLDAQANPNGAAMAALASLKTRDIEIVTAKAGDRLGIGEQTIEFLSPPGDASFELDNDHSLVAAIHTGTLTTRPLALLTGDIEDEAIAALRNLTPDLRPIVLELPHHGSARAAAIDWVQEALRPEVVLQSTGPRRAADPRWDRTRCNTWLCTATDGASWVEFFDDSRLRCGSFHGTPGVIGPRNP